MKKIILIILFCLVSSSAWATTYYVRTNGSTSTNCLGTTDVDYDGSGTGEACAFNHPFWAIPVNGGSGAMAGGDDLVIVNGTYRIGCQDAADCDEALYNVTSAECNESAPYDCYPTAIPDGTAGNHTTIYGCNTSGNCASVDDRPTLWGAGRIIRGLINLQDSDYVDVKGLNLTDHAECGGGTHPTLSCGSSDSSELSALFGITITRATHITIEDVRASGFYSYGMYGGGGSDLTFTNLELSYNAFGGWDADSCGSDGTCGMTGNISFVNPTIMYNGCIMDDLTYGTTVDGGCYSQDQGGYGDGIGTHNTAGTWTFDGANISWNVSDGLDLLYMNRGSYSGGSVTIRKSRFEGNAGNNVKTPNNMSFEDSFNIGNCGFFRDKSYTLYASEGSGRSGSTCDFDSVCDANENSDNCQCYDPSDGCNDAVDAGEGDCIAFNNCRANGNNFSIDFKSGDSATPKIYSSTITSNADVMIQTSGTCTAGVDLFFKNCIALGGREFNDDTSINASGGNDSTSVYYEVDGGGTCNNDFIEDYNICDDFKEATPCPAANSVQNSSPAFTGTILQGPYSSPGYYTGVDYRDQLLLGSGSPARGVSDETLSGDDEFDYNNYDRGASWDAGAYEYDTIGGGGSSTAVLLNTGGIRINLGGGRMKL